MSVSLTKFTCMCNNNVHVSTYQKMGCSYETKDSSNLKRHKLNHTTTVAAAALLLHCDFMGKWRPLDLNRFALNAKNESSLSIAYYHNQFFSLQYNISLLLFTFN